MNTDAEITSEQSSSLPRSGSTSTSPSRPHCFSTSLSSPAGNLSATTKASSTSCPSESRKLFVSSSQTSPLDSLQSWSSSALIVAQQYVGEHLGSRCRTAPDPEISARVAALREQRRQFVHVLQLATSLATQLEHVMRTQRCLGDALSELSQSGGNVPLGEQFSSSSDTLKLVSKNGDTLLKSLQVFRQGMSTLCNTTIEDTLSTVKNCEAARVKYDAYRQRVDSVKAAQTSGRNAPSSMKIREIEAALQLHRQRYERLQNDLVIKLKFLEENKASVCQKHLYMLHQAFLCYVSGSQEGVSNILKRCHFTKPMAVVNSPSELIALKSPNC